MWCTPACLRMISARTAANTRGVKAAEKKGVYSKRLLVPDFCFD